MSAPDAASTARDVVPVERSRSIRSAARDCDHPGGDAAARIVELFRASPDLQERLLDHVLRLRFVAQHAHRDCHRPSCVLVVEHAQRCHVPAGDAREQLAVLLPLRYILRARCAAARRQPTQGRRNMFSGDHPRKLDRGSKHDGYTVEAEDSDV